MLFFVSFTFCLFWLAYRHNYYYVQRNKVDTHGLLFNNALSQLFAGIYVLEVALIGLFFLVRDTEDNVACSSQAIIMIVVLILTAAFQYIMEDHLRSLYEFLPVALEDSAVEAERGLFLTDVDSEGLPDPEDQSSSDKPQKGSLGTLDGQSRRLSRNFGSQSQNKIVSATAARARMTLTRIKEDTVAKVNEIQAHIPMSRGRSRRQEVAEQMAAALGSYPDELTDLSPAQRAIELRAAFQDPVTRESAPIVWIPQDAAALSQEMVKCSTKYGRHLQYSNVGAYLTSKNKCEVTQPAPDVRPDWLLDWVL